MMKVRKKLAKLDNDDYEVNGEDEDDDERQTQITTTYKILLIPAPADS